MHSINYILSTFVFHSAASHPIQQVRHTQFYTKGVATNLQFFFTTYILAVTFCIQPCYRTVISCHSKLHTTYNVEKCTKNKKCNSRYPTRHNLPLNCILFISVFIYLIFHIQVIHIRLENLLDIEIVQMCI